MEGPGASAVLAKVEHVSAPANRMLLRMPDVQVAPAGRPRFGLRSLGSILILLCVSLFLRTWIITHTEVAARDSIGFIRYALQLEEKPWPVVFRENMQHPGYPLVVLAMSKIVRPFAAGITPLSM